MRLSSKINSTLFTITLLSMMMITSLHTSAQKVFKAEVKNGLLKEVPNQSALQDIADRYEAEKATQTELKKAFKAIDTLEDGRTILLDRVDTFGNPVYIEPFYTSRAALSVNAMFVTKDSSIHITGSNMVVGVWDQSVARMTHQEFLAGRIINKDNAATTSNHSTHVTATIIAQGTKQAAVDGILRDATVWGYDYNGTTPEITAAASAGLLVSNHSYGSYITENSKYLLGKYEGSANTYDNISYNAPYLSMVVAAGNRRDDGMNVADGGFDLISDGSVAKNTIVVGAFMPATSYPNMYNVVESAFSSWGPTDDYRLKPDVMAPGGHYSAFAGSDAHYGWSSGTSMAAPVVTAVIGMIQQYHTDSFGTALKSATVKALLANTAMDKGNVGPDFKNGWGLVDARKAVDALRAKNKTSKIIEASLTSGTRDTIIVKADGVNPLKVNLAWTDPAKSVNYGQYFTEDFYDKILINDLDMRIYDSQNNTYYPYTFDTSLTYDQVAQNGDNSRDNIEGIFLNNAAAGTYKIVISNKGTLQSGAQAYSLVATGIDNMSCPTPKCIGFDTLADGKLQMIWTREVAPQNAEVKVYSRTLGTTNTYQVFNDTSIVLSSEAAADSIDIAIQAYFGTATAKTDTSGMVTLNTVTPTANCLSVSYLSIYNVTNHSADLWWGTDVTDPNATFIIEYKKSSVNTWTTFSGVFPTYEAQITGIEAGNTYNVRIKQDCPNAVYYTANFETLAGGTSLDLPNIDINGYHRNGKNIIEVSSDEDIQEVEIQKYTNGEFKTQSTMTQDYSYIDGVLAGEQSVYKVVIKKDNEVLNKVVVINHKNEAGLYNYTIQNGRFTITDVMTDLRIDIHTAMGQKVDQFQVSNTGRKEIDLERYMSNMFIITISSESEVIESIKHIKN